MKFEYQARTPKGTVQSGIVEVSSQEAAIDILQRHNLIVTSLREIEEAPSFFKKLEIPLITKKVSLRDVSIFSRQLAILFVSEVPLVESLRTMGNQVGNSRFREKIFKISDNVESGTAFSKALSKYPEIFSSFYVSMIRAGELSGKLSESLSYLADHYESEYDIMSKVKGSMYYPAFIFCALIIVMTIMLLFVIPALTSVLEESGQGLPTVTRIIMAFTMFLRSWGWILFIFLAGGIVFFLYWKATAKGKKIWDKFILKVPVFGELFKKISLARFSENLSTLITGGLPISKSMEVAADVVGNETYRDIILKAEAGIRRGEFMSSIFKMEKEMPPLITQMILIGEKTGKLPAVLKNSAEFYKKEVTRMTDNLVSLVEPLMILVLGAAVGFIVVGIIMPIYQMAGTVF
ncbi:MAG: hypothetical protein COT36_00880 [Parcubacteria group bacterium CG08_land_8_20_14_0_20_38_56]|nr:MAG: hypothetical protein COT36_00880 [Parcubacteria group bacterium CG08_land_8_20_14_0_20_38_56]